MKYQQRANKKELGRHLNNNMKKRWFLYATGFFSGMSVMAIELGASRLLAPYFSSSQIVWTIVIGTIMIAMALGNILGGKMADKYKSPKKLFIFLFIAAVWTALIPLFGKFIISGVALLLALFVTKNYLIWAALISCLLVFVFPLLILGMVTPNLVKFTLQNEEESGKVVGIIEALNTIGSIIGTFIPTFVSIPNVGTALTFVIFASILFIICRIYVILSIINDKKRPSNKNIVTYSILTVVAILSIVGGVMSRKISNAFWNSQVIHEDESIYNYLKVEETDDSVIFSTNVLFGVQSIKLKQKGLTGMYYDIAMASPVAAGGNEKKLDVLILGLGTGTFATQCNNYLQEYNYDGVEIDKKIVEIAHEYFDLPDNVNTYIEDGRAFISNNKKKYDVIMVDAYQDITIPFQMSSIEFFRLVESHLKDNGNMVVNLNMVSNKDGSIVDYLTGTICNVFDNVYVSDASYSTNMELFATNNYDFKEKLAVEKENIIDHNLKNMINNVYDSLIKIEDNGYLLTDDKAPVELLGMSVLDEIIVSELNYYKNLIKGKSIKELIDMLFNGEFA